MNNRHIALYYCLPHLLLPLPALLLFPTLFHVIGFTTGTSAMTGAFIMLGLSFIALNRLPDLFHRDETILRDKLKLSFMTGIMLIIPFVISTALFEKSTKETIRVSYANLVNSTPNEYYELALPFTPDFSGLTLNSEHREWRRKQSLVTSIPYGLLHGRRIFLVENPTNRFGRTLSGEISEVKYKEAIRTSLKSTKARFENRSRSGRLIVKRISANDELASGFLSSDILLLWNIERPEETRSGLKWLAVLFYLFPYCLFFVFVPLFFGKEDRNITMQFLKETNQFRRLFCFSRENTSQ